MSLNRRERLKTCSVRGCFSSSKDNPSIVFFAFPQHYHHTFEVWFKFANPERVNPRWVCERHFDSRQYEDCINKKHHRHAVPTLHPGLSNPDTMEVSHHKPVKRNTQTKKNNDQVVMEAPVNSRIRLWSTQTSLPGTFGIRKNFPPRRVSRNFTQNLSRCDSKAEHNLHDDGVVSPEPEISATVVRTADGFIIPGKVNRAPPNFIETLNKYELSNKNHDEGLKPSPPKLMRLSNTSTKPSDKIAVPDINCNMEFYKKLGESLPHDLPISTTFKQVLKELEEASKKAPITSKTNTRNNNSEVLNSSLPTSHNGKDLGSQVTNQLPTISATFVLKPSSKKVDLNIDKSSFQSTPKSKPKIITMKDKIQVEKNNILKSRSRRQMNSFLEKYALSGGKSTNMEPSTKAFPKILHGTPKSLSLTTNLNEDLLNQIPSTSVPTKPSHTVNIPESNRLVKLDQKSIPEFLKKSAVQGSHVSPAFVPNKTRLVKVDPKSVPESIRIMNESKLSMQDKTTKHDEKTTNDADLGASNGLRQENGGVVFSKLVESRSFGEPLKPNGIEKSLGGTLLKAARETTAYYKAALKPTETVKVKYDNSELIPDRVRLVSVPVRLTSIPGVVKMNAQIKGDLKSLHQKSRLAEPTVIRKSEIGLKNVVIHTTENDDSCDNDNDDFSYHDASLTHSDHNYGKKSPESFATLSHDPTSKPAVQHFKIQMSNNELNLVPQPTPKANLNLKTSKSRKLEGSTSTLDLESTFNYSILASDDDDVMWLGPVSSSSKMNDTFVELVGTPSITRAEGKLQTVLRTYSKVQKKAKTPNFVYSVVHNPSPGESEMCKTVNKDNRNEGPDVEKPAGSPLDIHSNKQIAAKIFGTKTKENDDAESSLTKDKCGSNSSDSDVITMRHMNSCYVKLVDVLKQSSNSNDIEVITMQHMNSCYVKMVDVLKQKHIINKYLTRSNDKNKTKPNSQANANNSPRGVSCKRRKNSARECLDVSNKNFENELKIAESFQCVDLMKLYGGLLILQHVVKFFESAPLTSINVKILTGTSLVQSSVDPSYRPGFLYTPQTRELESDANAAVFRVFVSSGLVSKIKIATQIIKTAFKKQLVPLSGLERANFNHEQSCKLATTYRRLVSAVETIGMAFRSINARNPINIGILRANTSKYFPCTQKMTELVHLPLLIPRKLNSSIHSNIKLKAVPQPRNLMNRRNRQGKSQPATEPIKTIDPSLPQSMLLVMLMGSNILAQGTSADEASKEHENYSVVVQLCYNSDTKRTCDNVSEKQPDPVVIEPTSTGPDITIGNKTRSDSESAHSTDVLGKSQEAIHEITSNLERSPSTCEDVIPSSGACDASHDTTDGAHQESCSSSTKTLAPSNKALDMSPAPSTSLMCESAKKPSDPSQTIQSASPTTSYRLGESTKSYVGVDVTRLFCGFIMLVHAINNLTSLGVSFSTLSVLKVAATILPSIADENVAIKMITDFLDLDSTRQHELARKQTSLVFVERRYISKVASSSACMISIIRILQTLCIQPQQDGVPVPAKASQELSLILKDFRTLVLKVKDHMRDGLRQNQNIFPLELLNRAVKVRIFIPKQADEKQRLDVGLNDKILAYSWFHVNQNHDEVAIRLAALLAKQQCKFVLENDKLK